MIQRLGHHAFFSLWFLWPSTLALSGCQQQRPCPLGRASRGAIPSDGMVEPFTASTSRSLSQPIEVLHFHVDEAPEIQKSCTACPKANSNWAA